MGILMIVILNWLALRSHQLDNYKWSAVHYVTGGWSIYYIVLLLYGAFNVLLSSIEFQFASLDTLIFLFMSFTLSIFVLWQAVIYFLINLKELRN